MQCHSCRTEIPLAAGESVGFRDACDRCQADLHSCLNCAHHDPAAYNECRESSAERVLDQDRANRCEYFRPSERASAASEDQGGAINDLEKSEAQSQKVVQARELFGWGVGASFLLAFFSLSAFALNPPPVP